jgi:hypothetical protein
MFTNTKVDFVLTETPHEREEMFPIQEQASEPVLNGIEKSASVVFSEYLAESKSKIATPIFIP